MRAKTFTKYAKKVPSAWLPFADVSSVGLPLPRLLRLSLFKFTMGITTALMIGTLNRVMIVELGVPAWLVSMMLALPLLVAPLRAVTGYQSDVHRSALGWRRIPYMWGGTLIQFLGLAVMPFALLVLSGHGQVPVPNWVGQGAAAMAFLLVGAGLQTSQTAVLALATDQASEETQPRVVALLYTMLLLGAISGSVIFSLLLAHFTPELLVQVVQGTALVVLVINGISLWKQEARNPQRVAEFKGQAVRSFQSVWTDFIQLPTSRRFMWATALGTLAFNMQDIVLEPYGGEILKLSVGSTSALTGMLAAGGLLGFYFSGLKLAKGIDAMRLAAYGTLAGLPAFSAVIFSAPLDAGWLFRLGALGIGFGGGVFAVGTLFTAMRMEKAYVGLALGVWGAVQSAAAGTAMVFGGVFRDVVTHLSVQGALGPALSDPSVGYSMVYHLEMLFLFLTLISIGPLVKRRQALLSEVPHPLGLVESRIF